MRLICGHAQQNGRSFEEKLSFYNELKGEWDIHSADDLLICYGNLNGYIGRQIDGFHEFHRGYPAGRRNLEFRMLLVLPGERIESDTWIKTEKKEVTFRLEKEIDFVLIIKEH